jgi:hypothetical protein
MTRFLVLAILALPLCAQTYDYPNRVSVGIGRAIPAGQSAFDSGTLIGINFARRYTRNIQGDLGLQTSFNTDYRRFVPGTGAGLTTNTTYFVPVGGRIVVPVWDGRMEPSFGLGGVYVYDQRAVNSHHQGGAYGLAGVNYAVDSLQRHRVGITVRYFNIMSAGRPHPQWVNVSGEYSYSWGF